MLGYSPQVDTPLGRHPPARHPLGRHPPAQCMLGYTVPSACWDRHGYCCGRYASYWNAFLFQVKLKAMKQHENQVDELGKLATHIVETKENGGTVKADMDTFSEKWTLVFQKLSK